MRRKKIEKQLFYTFVADLISRGISIEVVAIIAGHSKEKVSKNQITKELCNHTLFGRFNSPCRKYSFLCSKKG